MSWYRRFLRNRGEERDQALSAIRARFESFLAALRADTFDRALVGDLLDQQSQAALRRQELGEQLLLDRLSGMTQAEREAYADALEERLKGFRRR